MKEDLTVATTKKLEYKLKLETFEKLSSKISKYANRLKNLDKLQNKLTIIDVLHKAYGDKGLKLKQINRLCSNLVDRLNVYSSIMFQERSLAFEHRDFDIVAIREYGGVKKVVDIANFSGGEKKRLIPCLMLAQRDLLPASKRVSLILADEWDANLDSIAKKTFVNNLLPVLKNKFATTVIIAHSQEMHGPIYNKEWKIIKKKGVSSLHVSNLNRRD